MKKIGSLIMCVLVFMSCSEDNDDALQTLATYIEGETIEIGAVIACAASDKDSGDILTFYYPEEGVSDIRYYETLNSQVDASVFSNYTRVFLNSEPIFNGYLERFTQKASIEKWIIVTFELDDEIKISNPIRSKQISKPTVWNDEVEIDQSQPEMPVFTWQNNAFGDNAIYFQVVTDEQDNLLSGTYTFENQFQYYNTSNVVLNITTETPPSLSVGTSYNFTLMDVSEDNWVNLVVLNKNFIAQ